MKNHGVLAALLVWAITPALWSAAQDFRFDEQDSGPADAQVATIQPWARIPLDPHAGQWIVTGDVNGDGEVDVVTARNVDRNDVHFTSAVCAQRLDGEVLWRWGSAEIGRRELHHDVACQIYDWNGDGRNEVIVATDGFVVHLDGTTGRELRRLPIPAQASDCLVFANLSGKPRATDFLVKTRYSDIWAYDYEGRQLWHVHQPGGFRTAHQPVPIDLDGDKVDEIVAGYAVLNRDGSIRWTYASETVNLARGHLDAVRLFEAGPDPAGTRLVLTCCGANNLALIDGAGRVLWELAGHHFESIRVAELLPDVPGKEILVDIDHLPRGESLLWVVSAAGQPLTQIRSEYCRHHQVIDWDGDGCDEIVIARSRGLFNGRGQRIGTFAMGDETTAGDGILVLPGDMTGDGVPDITLTTLSAVYVYRNPAPRAAVPASTLGCGANFTLY